jgi:hypothetical protein
MSEISIQAVKVPIVVSATSSGVSATVAGASVTTTTTGGVGPQGPQGIQGPPGDSIGSSSDVQIAGLTDGDLLSYSTTAGAWTNADTIDAGNF